MKLCILFLLALAGHGRGQEGDIDEDGILHVNEAWGLKPGNPIKIVRSARFPEDAPANLLQTWRALAMIPDGVIRINCEKIYIPTVGGGKCSQYSLTLEDGNDTKVFCGGYSGLSILSKTNDITLTLKTGPVPRGVVDCKVQARKMGPYGEVTDPPTTPEPTTQKSILPAYLSIESEEIDSSEHGGPPGRVPTTCPCGTANKQLNKIIGGEEAGVNEFPFAVMLTIKGRYAPFCGGSIITARHVITAAHCVVGLRDWVTIAVRMGDHNFNEENAPHSKTVDVSEIIVHEKYSEHHNYDIALLVLNETIKFNRFVFPVCIPAKQLSLDRQYLKAMGWGRTGWTKENGLSIYLKKMNVRAVPLSECARFTSADASDPHQLCTYGKRRGLGKGDSGGPVVWLDKDTNRYTIVGLPSFVYPFLTQNYKPDVTADVSSFLPWIHEKLKRSAPEAQACWSTA